MTLRRATVALWLTLAALLVAFALLPCPAGAQGVTTQCIANVAAQGTSDAITSAQLPCGTTTNLVILTAAAANTTTTPTYAPIGSPPLPIIRANGSPVSIGDLTPGYVAMLSSTGTSWVLLNPASVISLGIPVSPSQGGTGLISPTGLLVGNGAAPMTAVPPGIGVIGALGSTVTGSGGIALSNSPTFTGTVTLPPGTVIANLGFTPLSSVANLADLNNTATARVNLGLGALATENTLLASQCPLFTSLAAGCVRASGGSSNTFLNGSGAWTYVPTTGVSPVYVSIQAANGIIAGTDSTTCGDFASPCKNLSYAVANRATSGTVIECNDGVYQALTAIITITNSIDIESVTPGGCVIQRPANISVTASMATNVLTVTAVSGGTILAGMSVSGLSVPANSIINAYGSGGTTGVGGIGTYQLTTSATIASESMTIAPASTRIMALGTSSAVNITIGAVAIDGQNIDSGTLSELILMDVGNAATPYSVNFNNTRFLNYGRYGVFEPVNANYNISLFNAVCTSSTGQTCIFAGQHNAGSFYSYGMTGVMTQTVQSSDGIAVAWGPSIPGGTFQFLGPFNLDITVNTAAADDYGLTVYDTPGAAVGCGTGAPNAQCGAITMHGTSTAAQCNPVLMANSTTPIEADGMVAYGVAYVNDCAGGGKGGVQIGFDGDPDGHAIIAPGIVGTSSPYTITASGMPAVAVGTVVTVSAHGLSPASLAGQYTVTASSAGSFTATTTATGTWVSGGYVLLNQPVVGYHANHGRIFGNTSTNGTLNDASQVVEGGQFCGYESDCQQWDNATWNTDYGYLFKACLQCFAWGNTGTGLRRPFIDIKGIATGSGFFNNTNYETLPLVASLPFTASIASNVLTVTVAPTPTNFRPGMVIAGAGITGSPTIAAFGSGGTSGTGGTGTYQLSASFTISSEAMTAATNTAPAGITIENDQFNQPSTGATFGNNNVALYYAGANNRTFVNDGAGDVGNTATFTHNNYYNAGTSTLLPFTFNGVNYANLAAWQGAFEPSATGVDPVLVNPGTNFCGLQPTSPMIAAGVTVAAPVNLGYDGVPFTYPTPSVGAVQWSGNISSVPCHP